MGHEMCVCGVNCHPGEGVASHCEPRVCGSLRELYPLPLCVSWLMVEVTSTYPIFDFVWEQTEVTVVRNALKKHSMDDSGGNFVMEWKTYEGKYLGDPHPPETAAVFMKCGMLIRLRTGKAPTAEFFTALRQTIAADPLYKGDGEPVVSPLKCCAREWPSFLGRGLRPSGGREERHRLHCLALETKQGDDVYSFSKEYDELRWQLGLELDGAGLVAY